MKTTASPTRSDETRLLDSLPDYLTVDEVSNLLQIPKNTLYYWRQHGEGPKSRSLGRHLRYSKVELVRWVNSHEER